MNDVKDTFKENFKHLVESAVSIRHHIVLGKLYPVFLCLWDTSDEDVVKDFEKRILYLKNKGFKMYTLPEYFTEVT